VFLFSGYIDPATIKSNMFKIEWPPHSGQQAAFPEIDRGEWFTVEQSREKLSAQMMGMVEELTRVASPPHP
jgi:predicted NUDIX family NTP pyrophosphohydrolase